MTFVFGQQSKCYDPSMIYVNNESISQEMYHRLCSNPSDAIIIYDKHHNNKTQSHINSIYNQYNINQFGISTMFDTIPSLTECQSLWNQQLDNLKQECIKNSSVIIVEANPITVM